MLVKRYHASDMQEAMDTIIRELGSDAVVLNSQKVKKKGIRNLFSKPVLEVMVAYDPAKVPTAKKYPSFRPQGGAAYNAGAPSLTFNPEQAQLEYAGKAAPASPQWQMEEAYMQQKRSFEETKLPGFEELKPRKTSDEAPAAPQLDDRIESLDNMLNSFIQKFSYIKKDITYDFSKDIESLFVRLIENQVKEEVAHSLAKEADAILKREEADAQDVMLHLIMEQIGEAAPIEPKKFKQKIILLIGPTGVGKTTSLVKLAANFTVKQKKKVGIINTDTYRIAAQEQLKTYADILSIPLNVVYQLEDMSEILESMEDREIIFIDTAGKRPGDEKHREDIKKIIEIAAPEDILLCLSAGTSFSSLKEIIDTYSFIDRYKLLVTKLDETRYRGMILNLSWYAKKSLAYVTIGQNVPDDIENVNTETLAKEILGL